MGFLISSFLATIQHSWEFQRILKILKNSRKSNLQLVFKCNEIFSNTNCHNIFGRCLI